MNRRDFLKALGITVAAAYLPIPSLNAYPHFDPKHEYGDYVWVTDPMKNDKNDPIVRQCVQILEEQIKMTIPERYRDRISWHIIESMPVDGRDWLERRGTVGWKYSPRNPRRETV